MVRETQNWDAFFLKRPADSPKIARILAENAHKGPPCVPLTHSNRFAGSMRQYYTAFIRRSSHDIEWITRMVGPQCSTARPELFNYACLSTSRRAPCLAGPSKKCLPAGRCPSPSGGRPFSTLIRDFPNPELAGFTLFRWADFFRSLTFHQ